MRLSIASALTAALLLLSGCDDIVDSVNLDRGPVDVENGTAHTLQRLYHPPCGTANDGEDRIAGEPDLQPGQVLAIDLPGGICRDFKADFSDGRRRVITNVTPDADQRQRITFR
jgi:hypothetical protein